MSPKKNKILFVDDDPGNLNFLRLAFMDYFTVLTASNGREALKILEDPKNLDVALILSDERMPIMKGSELLERTLTTHPNTIRWLITAFPRKDTSIYDMYDLHIDRFIRKPLKDKLDYLKEDAIRAVELYCNRVNNLALSKRLEGKRIKGGDK